MEGETINVALWAAQAFLLVAFAIGFGMKVFLPIPRLAGIWPWAGDLRPALVRGVGLIDLLGGLGVVLPMLIGIVPALTVAAALGCVALQVCAALFHASRRELGSLPVNALLLVLAAFVAWGRWGVL